MANVTFRFKGIKDAEARLKKIKTRAQNSPVMASFAEEVKARLVYSIELQTFKHEPLSTKWANKKDRLGLDPRILIATGEYVDSIFTGQTSTGFFVSIPEGLTKRAAWMEFGTRTTVARPHWRPVAMWAQGRWGEILRRFGADILR